MRMRTSIGAAALAAARLAILGAALAAPAAAGDGPGLGNFTYDPSELFQPLSVIASEPFRPLGPDGPAIPVGHGNVAMVNGYLMVISSLDGGGVRVIGAIEFWDVSDPRHPVLAHRWDDVFTQALREPHGFSLARVDGRDVLAAQGVDGILFWDVTDPADVVHLSYLDLPDITAGDYTGDWWVFWQAPLVYVAGTGSGLYVVDASDPADPVLVNRVPISETAGLSPGQVFAVGNLLLLVKNEGGQYVTLDIGDPVNPVLIESHDGKSGYSHIFAGGRILTSGDADRRLHVTDVSHDGRMSFVGSAGSGLGKGGYGSYQDGFFLGGFSNQVAKLDIASLTQVGSGTTGIAERDEDFGQVVGNLVFGGDDHGVGSGLLVHQIEPDRLGPEVTWVHPADAAGFQPVTTRVGLSLSDHVDLDSLTGGALLGAPRRRRSAARHLQRAVRTGELRARRAAAPGSGVRSRGGRPRRLGGQRRRTFREPVHDLSRCTAELLARPPGSGARGRSRRARRRKGQRNPAPRVPVELRGRRAADAGVSRKRRAARLRRAGPLRRGAPGDGAPRSGQLLGGADRASPAHAEPARRGHAHRSRRDLCLEREPRQRHGHGHRRVAVGGHRGARRDAPAHALLAPDGDVWVANQDDATLTVLSPSGTMLATHPLPRGSQPYGIAFRPDGASALVTLAATGELAEVALDGRVLRRVAVGPRPRGLAISADSSRAFVSRFVSPAGQGEVRVVDLASFAVTGVLSLGFDPGPDTESSGRGVPNYLSQLRITPDGRRLLVPSKKDNVARGEFRDGQALTFESRVRPIVSEIDLASDAEDAAARIDLNDRDLPQAALTSPLGDVLVVAVQGSNRVELFDARTRQLLGGVNTGRAPQGLALAPGGGRLFVHNYMSRSVSVFEMTELFAGASNSATLLAEVSTVAAEKLAPDVLAGKRVFYDASDPRMSRDGYISCASCHLDGGSDGQVWDFTQVGEGLRNTIELTGRAGLGHGNVHWTANFDEIQDFENDIREGFDGAGFLSNDDFDATRDPLGAPKAGRSPELDQLSAYVSSLDRFPLSPHRTADGQLTLEGLLGRFLFAKHGCQACHSGDAFSDGLRHDVGTRIAGSGLGIGQPLAGVGFETPTLRGLWLTAPYLHAGQAPTLRDVLGNAAHAGSVLSPLEADLLVAYLLQIDEEETLPQCADGVDNDGDGRIDFGGGPDGDGECIWVLDDSEVEIPSCGLGFEIAPILAGVGWARRRSRRRRQPSSSSGMATA